MFESLLERIRAAGDDVAALMALKGEVDDLTGPEARDLKLRFGTVLFKSRKSSGEISIKSILSRNGLERADGRPLYKYTLSEAEFNGLRELLRTRCRNGFADCAWDIPALFVLWGAHWFRLKYRGGIRRWEDVGAALSVPFDGNDGRRLVREGLKVWSRPSVKGENTQQWLMTLAVEGGFPAGVLEGAEGWLSRYLLRVVVTLLQANSITPEMAFSAAEKEADSVAVPHAYRQEIFYAIAGDLASSIASLRRKAKSSDRPKGITTSEWLDVIEPEWREVLPISMGEEAAVKLVNGLIESPTTGLSADRTIGCERLLRLRGDVWRPAVRLGLDGFGKGGFLSAVAKRTERIRVHASALFARYALGELAFLDPPGNAQDDWRVRPSRGDPVIGVPLTTAISVELRCDGTAFAHAVWPQGGPLRGDMAVFAGDLLGDVLGDELSLVGTGSGSFRPKVVAVVVPGNWTVSEQDAGSHAERLESVVEDGRALWRVQGAAIIRSPEGDAFRIATDSASSRRDELQLDGIAPVGLISEESDVELFAGPPRIRVAEGSRIREAHVGEVFWRAVGERAWQALPVGIGKIEIGWKDTETGFIRDRRRAFLLPSRAWLECRKDRGTMAYRPVGFALSAIDVADDNLVLERADDKAVVRFVRHAGRRAKLSIKLGVGPPVIVSAPVLLGAGIATWSGTRVSGGPTSYSAANMSLAELAECVAFADGRQALVARLLDRDRRTLKGGRMRWAFDDEMPLGDVAEELSARMALFGDIDVYAELSLQDGSAYWRIRQFEMGVDTRAGHLTTTEGFARDDNVALFGRPVDRPWEERQLAQWSFSDRVEHRFPETPSDVTGVWIVYGRRGDTIVSRPKIKAFGWKSDIAPGLPSAAMIADHSERELAIRARVELIASGAPEAEADVNGIVMLCANLCGVPPASFDVLKIVTDNPVAAARLALRASPEKVRRAVLDIANGLTFAWFLIPVSAWKKAADIERAICASDLTVAGVADSDRVAERVISAAAKAVAAIEPILAWPLFAATGVVADDMPLRHSLSEAAQDHIRRYGDQVEEDGDQGSVFRDLLPGLLPQEFHRFSPVHLEVLDAPCAAAVVAGKGIEVAGNIVRQIKLWSRLDAIYFSDAFSSYLIHSCSGK